MWSIPLFFLSPALSEGKKGDYGMVSVRTSVCPAHNSATVCPIHSKSSSLELSQPLDVQRHGHLPIGGHMGVPMGAIRAPGICNEGFWNLSDTRTWQPLVRFTPNWVLWNRLSLQMCNVMAICPWGHNGCAHGHDKGSWNLADTGTPQPLVPIHAKSSSLELSWPVNVQRHGHLPIRASRV